MQDVRDGLRPDADRPPSTTGPPSRPGWPRCRPRSPATRRRCAWPPARGDVAPQRQVLAGIDAGGQERRAADGFFAHYVAAAGRHGRRLAAGASRPTSSARRRGGARRLRRAGASSCATSCCRRRRRSTRSAPSGTRCTRAQFLGTAVDLAETYAWGQSELARITAQMRDRRRDPARRLASPRRSRTSTPTRPASCTAPPRCRPGCRASPTRRSQRWATPTSTSRTPIRTLECRIAPTDAGRHLLHRPERGLHPPGPDVVVGARGRHRVLDLERADDRLPRGRARPSPADRADGVPPRAAQPLAPARLVDHRGTARAGRSTPSG